MIAIGGLVGVCGASGRRPKAGVAHTEQCYHEHPLRRSVGSFGDKCLIHNDLGDGHPNGRRLPKCHR